MNIVTWAKSKILFNPPTQLTYVGERENVLEFNRTAATSFLALFSPLWSLGHYYATWFRIEPAVSDYSL